MKTVRTNIGAIPFWLLGMGLSILFWALQIPTIGTALLLFTVMIGTWVELEQRGFSLFKSALAGLSSALAVAVGATYLVTRKNPAVWQDKLMASIDAVIARVSKVDLVLAQSLKADELMLQIPSVVVIVFVIAAAMVAIFDKPILQWSGHTTRNQERLTDFKLPDFFIWLLIAAVFFAFWEGSNKLLSTVSINVLNVLTVCFFFQGLAVLCRYFQVFSVGYFWRVIWIAIFTFQLFLVLSFVGVADYWFDFRKKLMKKSSELKKKSISE